MCIRDRHCAVETLDRHFGNVCELDIMFHLEKAHYVLDEMVANGAVLETNKAIVLDAATRYAADNERDR